MSSNRLTAVMAVAGAVLFSFCSSAPSPTSSSVQVAQPPRLEFSRMLVHWSQYIDPGYLAFVDEVRPEVVQVGFYGADFWALTHVPKQTKGPTAATQPVDGDLKASGEFLENLNRELHERGIKVVGHIDTTYHLTGFIDGPQGPREGFFKFYNELWDEDELGPRPISDPLELLQRNPDGSPRSIKLDGFSPWPIYHGCLNNPHWRAVLKAWVKRGIQRGLDGFIINYFYTNGCMCQYCVRGFKDQLRQQYSPAELRTQFGIDDLDQHRFAEINGWYRPGEMTPLRLEGQRFSDISRKKAFDKVFIEYGRSLKPDLILAQWLHSYQPVARNDERMMLPPQLWAKGEDYLWYCVGKNEPTLQLRYMRGAGGDRPYTICHYEHVKVRASMAELAANGGAPMTRHADFNDAESRQELVRFFSFMRRHDEIYQANQMAGEAVLLFPRAQYQQGRFTAANSAFHAVGNRLLDDHVLFDVIPDDLAAPDVLARYRRVFTISSELDQETYEGLSRFEAPATVRVSANRPAKGDEIDIHFVNYARSEPEEKRRTGFVADENPVSVSGVQVDLVLPEGLRAAKVEFMTPESPDPLALPVDQPSGHARFTVPQFLVYAVARIYLEPVTVAATDAVVAAAPPNPVASKPRQAAPPRTGWLDGRTQHTAADGCDPTACNHGPIAVSLDPGTRITDYYSEDIVAARTTRRPD